MGDVLHIDAGSTFYMVNPGKGQRLQIICSVDASDSLGFGPPYQVSPPPLLFCTLVVFLSLLLAGKRTCSTCNPRFPALMNHDPNPMQAFFLGGAGDPASVIAGFGPKTLTRAFNVRYIY